MGFYLRLLILENGMDTLERMAADMEAIGAGGVDGRRISGGE